MSAERSPKLLAKGMIRAVWILIYQMADRDANLNPNVSKFIGKILVMNAGRA
jgi:hypothetical protein